jgi:hypothetical protein
MPVGSLPTNWSYSAGGTGLSAEVVAVGTERGFATLDVRVFGTATAGGDVQINFETATAITAANAQHWCAALYARLVGGALTGVAPKLAVIENTAAGALVTSGSAAFTPSASFGRYSHTRTLAGGGTVARVQPALLLTITNGAAVDVTLRLYHAQMEQVAAAGLGPSSVIMTSGVAVTREADFLTGSLLGAWFNVAEGAIAIEFMPSGLPATGTFPRAVSLNDASTANEIATLVNGTNKRLVGFIRAGGVDQADSTANTPFTLAVDATVAKQALRYKANDFAISNNGAAVIKDASVTIPTVTQMQFGRTASSNIGSFWVRRFRYWNKTLTDAQLVEFSK